MRKKYICGETIRKIRKNDETDEMSKEKGEK